MGGRRAVTYVRAGDTEPLEFTVGATGLESLDGLVSAELFARVDGEDENHVHGAPCSVFDSEERVLRFDPEGAGPDGSDAFDLDITEPTRVRCYVLITWADGDTTRHPAADDGTLDLHVTPRYD